MTGNGGINVMDKGHLRARSVSGTDTENKLGDPRPRERSIGLKANKLPRSVASIPWLSSGTATSLFQMIRLILIQPIS